MGRIRKRPSSRKEAEKMQSSLDKKYRILRGEANLLGVRFHGSKEESLERIRKEGLKRRKTFEKVTYFGNPETADLSVYSAGKKWSVVHSVPRGYFEKMEKKGKLSGTDFYAGHSERHALFDIPPARIRTYVKNVRRLSFLKADPLLYRIEQQMEKEGKTMKQRFEENPTALHHKINYYSLLLADDAYEKNSKTLRKTAESLLKGTGKVNFGELRKTADRLGILPELQDYVIGSVFIDMRLKKSRSGFVKK